MSLLIDLVESHSKLIAIIQSAPSVFDQDIIKCNQLVHQRARSQIALQDAQAVPWQYVQQDVTNKISERILFG